MNLGDHDWGKTPLGPIEGWRPEVRSAATLALEAGFPTVLVLEPGLTVVANDGFREIFGDGRNVNGVALPDVLRSAWTVLEPVVRDALAGRTVARRDVPFAVERGGAETDGWFSFSCSPMRLADGRIAGVIGTVIETTARRMGERARAESEARFRTMADTIDDVFYLVDLDAGTLLYISPAYQRIWGRPAAPLMADLSTLPDAVHPDDRAITRSDLAAQARGEAVWSEYRIIRPDGEVRWILDRCRPVQASDGRRWASGIAVDITERKRAAAALELSEGRQRFLLALEDALRPLESAEAVQATAIRILGEQLHAARVHYAEVPDGEERLVAGPAYARGVEPIEGSVHLLQFGAALLAGLRSERAVVVPDALATAETEAQAELFRRLRIGALVGVGLVKDGRLVASLGVHDTEPRQWTDAEVSLIEAAAERTWAAVERVRAERERDRFFELSVDLLAMASLREGSWVRVNPAFARILGWQANELAGRSYLDTIHPDDRARSEAAAARLAAGEPLYDFQNRVRRKDGSYRWISWNSASYPAEGQLYCVGRDVTEARAMHAALSEGEARLRLLVADLQHRVRNMLAVVRSVFARSVEASGDVHELAGHFRGRLDALARAQVVVAGTASQTADLEDLIRDELLSVGVSDGPALSIGGPEVALPSETAEMLGLAIHELATNALKFGALRSECGTLAVEWTLSGEGPARRLELHWREGGVRALPVNPARRGFGQQLIEDALGQRLGATTSLEFRGGGVRCTISLPLV